MRHLFKFFLIYLLFVLCGCGTSSSPSESASPNSALFDPTTSTIPLPNILATATAADPFLNYSGQVIARPQGRPMNPLEALSYVNRYEVGGTNAVAGVNAPIYIRFSRAVDPATVTAANIKVFQVTPDSATDTSSTENHPLQFRDISQAFDYTYTPGKSDLLLFPKFPLSPATRYLYLVTNRVKDAATGGSIIGSVYFEALKSPLPLGAPFTQLEAIRDNVYTDASRTTIKLSGYAKTMNDLIASPAVSTITSRSEIALLGRFITTGAGFVLTQVTNAASAIPVESALRSFAAGATLGGLPGKSWANAVSGISHPTPADYFGQFGATAPASVAQVTLGNIDSADLSMDPVLVKTNSGSMDLTAVPNADNPAAGVLQPFRIGENLTGFYHIPRTVPFVYLTPAAPNGKLIIFQHGITRQKEDVVAVAQALTGAGFAVVAIDLPLHGQLAVPGHALSLGDSAATISLKQSEWGADFVAAGAPLATRTNIQQAAFNLDRLELTARTGGFASFGGFTGGVPAEIKFTGLSLGAIVGTYYLAGNTTLDHNPSNPPYTQTSLNGDMKALLNVPGGRLAYLLRDSPSFGPSLAAGLTAKGITAGTPTYEQFFLLTQSVVDPADPATMTTPLAAGLPSRLSGRVLVQEATSTTFSAAGAPTNGDQVITNAYTRYLGNALGGRGILGTDIAPGFKQLSYFNGSLPALFMLNQAGAAKTAAAAGLPSATSPTEGYFQFNQADVTHSFLIDLANSPASLQLAQRQMFYFLSAGVVVDPTQVSSKPVLFASKGVSGQVSVPKMTKILGN